jgi:membrane protease subunit HflK
MNGNEWDPKGVIPQITPQNAFKYGGRIILGVILIVVFATSIYTVGTDERGMVLRFGKFVRMTEPGLHAKLPFWFESVKTPKVERIFKEEFGFQTLRAGIETVYSGRKLTKESLMLCGDLNVAEVEWIVQFKIREPEKFLFRIRNPRRIIRDTSEGVMREVVGDSSVDEVLTIRRVEVNIEAQDKMQKILDLYDAGIEIVTVKLQDVNPPEQVKPAFNEVNAAQQDRERYVNKALEEYNKVIPKARGEAQLVTKQAEGYAINRVNVAKGDARRFVSMWEEYRGAKEVTRRRFYLETLAEGLPKVGKIYIIDEEVKSLLPLLKLGEE